MSKLGAARLLMILSILALTIFQGYWLRNVYREEKSNLQRSADLLFRESMYGVQAERFKQDTLIYRGIGPNNLFVMDVVSDLEKRALPKDSGASLREQRSMMISVKKDSTFFTETVSPDSVMKWTQGDRRDPFQDHRPGHSIVRYLETNTTVGDTIPLQKIDSAYRAALAKSEIDLPFSVVKLERLNKPAVEDHHIHTSLVPVGLMRATGYQAVLFNPTSYLMRKIVSQVLFSLLLLALTVVSFIFIFRSLLQQNRLTESKNEFISNITHELKTPISTVGVSIEAMRNFNVLENPDRTNEYLNIAGSELKRLEMLVDKVLRLSMFENRALALQYEVVKLDEIVEEVLRSMRLQFEKNNAAIDFQKTGNDFSLKGDHLHLVSVVYNLLDNALKYSKGNIQIKILLEADPAALRLTVEDNGIGISREYHQKIFEKFFRVPGGDRHDVKGYGLGLSYVSHIVEEHGGKILVQSQPGEFTRIGIELPRNNG